MFEMQPSKSPPPNITGCIDICDLEESTNIDVGLSSTSRLTLKQVEEKWAWNLKKYSYEFEWNILLKKKHLTAVFFQ